MINRRSLLACVATCALLAVRLVAAAEPQPVLVFAAASLTNAQDDIDGLFTTATKVPVKASYASSSTLAKQIEAGAPAGLFISADTDWMDYLEKRDLLVPGTRREILANRLVLVAAADSKVQLVPAPGFDLNGALAGGHLAMGNPDSVPAGIYGKAALQKLGVWDAVEGHVAAADSVRAALALVSRGEAPLGIVYRTDALVDKGVRIAGEFPESSHAPIHYPAALVKGASPEARKLLDFLSQKPARDVFSKYGFTPLP